MLFLVCVAGLFVASSAQKDGGAGDKRVCREYNAYYKIQGSCDSYVECNAYKATYKTCPDGLHFVRDVKWPEYPCAYPSDAQCDFSDAPQKAMPTAECKHQYGMFVSPLASRTECGKYRMCVEGKAYEMECAAGLAFNPETGVCDWPNLVKTCDADAYLGFKCPKPTYDESGRAYVENFGIEGNCRYFYSCIEGVARLQLCDNGYAFDKSVNRCVDATRVKCKDE